MKFGEQTSHDSAGKDGFQRNTCLWEKEGGIWMRLGEPPEFNINVSLTLSEKRENRNRKTGKGSLGVFVPS